MPRRDDLPSALNICMPPYFPSNSTVLFRGLNARHILTSTTSRQPGETERERLSTCLSRSLGSTRSLGSLVGGKTLGSRLWADLEDRGLCRALVLSPDLSSRIWSFWHSSMNPEIRLANSTTYCIAWVIWMAHCCHSTSRVYRERNSQVRRTLQVRD